MTVFTADRAVIPVAVAGFAMQEATDVAPAATVAALCSNIRATTHGHGDAMDTEV